MTCQHGWLKSFTVTLICHNVTLSKRKKAQEYGWGMRWDHCWWMWFQHLSIRFWSCSHCYWQVWGNQSDPRKKNVEGCSKVTDVNAAKQVLQNLGKSTSKSVLAVFFVSYFCQPMVSWWFGLFNRVTPICNNPFHKGILGITNHRDPNHQCAISWFYKHRCCFLWKNFHETLRSGHARTAWPSTIGWVLRVFGWWLDENLKFRMFKHL